MPWTTPAFERIALPSNLEFRKRKKFRPKHAAAALGVSAFLAGGFLLPECAQARTVERTAALTLILQQSVASPSSATATLTTKAATSVPTFDANFGFGTGRNVGLPSGYTGLFAMAHGSNKKASQIESDMKSYIDATLGTHVDALKQWAIANGASHAALNFEQAVNVIGKAAPRMLQFRLLVDRDGKHQIHMPQVVNPIPSVVYAEYVSKSVSNNLPPSWGYSDGGNYRWRIQKRDGTPLTPFTTIATGGVYDEPPPPADGSDFNPDLNVPCLIDASSAGCPAKPAGMLDIKAIMDEESAERAILDYKRAVAPVYVEVQDPPGSGVFVSKPKLSTSFDERSYEALSCTDYTYRNAGNVGYQLQSTVSRYSITPLGDFEATGDTQLMSLSPTMPFNYVKAITAGELGALSNLVINPLEPSNPLVAANDVGYTTLAPVIDKTQSTGTFPLGLASQVPDLAFTIAPTGPNKWQAIATYQDGVPTGLGGVTSGMRSDGANAGQFDRLITINAPTAGTSVKLTGLSGTSQMGVALNGGWVYLSSPGDSLVLTEPNFQNSVTLPDDCSGWACVSGGTQTTYGRFSNSCLALVRTYQVYGFTYIGSDSEQWGEQDVTSAPSCPGTHLANYASQLPAIQAVPSDTKLNVAALGLVPVSATAATHAPNKTIALNQGANTLLVRTIVPSGATIKPGFSLEVQACQSQ